MTNRLIISKAYFCLTCKKVFNLLVQNHTLLFSISKLLTNRMFCISAILINRYIICNHTYSIWPEVFNCCLCMKQNYPNYSYKWCGRAEGQIVSFFKIPLALIMPIIATISNEMDSFKRICRAQANFADGHTDGKK